MKALFGISFGLLTSLALFTSCTKDKELDGETTVGEEDQKYSWVENADPEQSWITAKPVQLNMVGKSGSKVKVVSIGDYKPTVYAEQTLKGNSVLKVDIPQGAEENFAVLYSDGTPYQQQYMVTLSDEDNQTVDLNFDKGSSAFAAAATAPLKANINPSLMGNSIEPDCGYMHYGNWIWNVLGKALPESQNSTLNHAAIIDYELLSFGDLIPGGELLAKESIYVSFVYGFTGQYNTRILGYYTHSTNSYEDIQFHDLTECLVYDYINGKAKVQYQLDGVDKWYDANFDYRDGFSKPYTTQSQRLNDDIYNTKLVFDRYKDRITAVRGLTFKLDIKKGQKFGFYLKLHEAMSSDQRDRLIKKGVPQEKIPSCGVNFSFAELNRNGYHASAMSTYDNFTFMGLDDTSVSSDYDCNDITLAMVSANGNRYEPIFTEETLESEKNDNTLDKHPEIVNPNRPNPNTPKPETDKMPDTESIINQNLQRWTIGFEDAGTDIDFDFNDVVLQVAPVYYLNKVSIWLMAAGGKRKIVIYYTDSKGVEHNLGEVHNLFKVNTATMVNTTNGTEKSAVLLSGKDGLDWPEGGTVQDNRHRFRIEVYDPAGTTVQGNVYADTKFSNSKASNVPVALTVVGQWQWPLENQAVNVVYPTIGKWCQNHESKEAWNWYATPMGGKSKTWWKNWWK